MTRRILALLTIIAAAVLVRHAGVTTGAEGAGHSAALAAGFALIAAVLVGTLVERISLPRLTGYLLLGLLAGPYVGNLITSDMARQLRVLNGLAVALIALVAGLELNVAHLRPQFRGIGAIGGTAIAVVWTLLLVLTWAAFPLLPLELGSASPVLRIAVSAIVATLAASFSPTVTIAVLAEARARGPFSELTLAVVVAADLIVILLFTASMEAARWASGGTSAEEVATAVVLAWEIVGSAAFGAIVGSAFAMYLRFVGRELTVVLIGVCALLSLVAPLLHLDPVLAALAAGLVVENIAPPRGDVLRRAVEQGSLPVLIVFFAAAGASLNVDALATTAPIAVAAAVVRAAGIWAGAALGGRLAGLNDAPARMVWMGLISQAGVTVGLASIVAREFPGWGGAVQTLVLALTAIHVLVGPVMLRTALARSGEVGRG